MTFSYKQTNPNQSIESINCRGFWLKLKFRRKIFYKIWPKNLVQLFFSLLLMAVIWLLKYQYQHQNRTDRSINQSILHIIHLLLFGQSWRCLFFWVFLRFISLNKKKCLFNFHHWNPYSNTTGDYHLHLH